MKKATLKLISVLLIISVLQAAVCLCAPLTGRAAASYEFYVAVDGSDDSDGSFSRPFATLEGAQKYLREHKSELKGDVTVYFRGGTYVFEEQARFTAEDLPGVTYASYIGETAVFTAAVPLTGFEKTKVNGADALVLSTDLRFNTLYHPQREIKTPRLPETGSFTVKEVDHSDDIFDEKTTYWEASRGNTSFNADPGEVGLDFSRPESVYCRVVHAWLDEIARIRFYDAESGKVGLGRPATYEIKPGDVYWFENVFEALDSPGEWYLDEGEGKLYYVPFEGETAQSLTLYAPVSQYLMNIDGCSGLKFEGIRFFGSEWTLAVPPENSGVRSEYNIDAYQASTESDAAVNVRNADGITFKNCEFIDIGNTAVRFIKNAHDCAVESCIFRRTGSTAIAVYGENVTPDAENAAEAMSGFRIYGNLIEAYGRNTYESTGVHLMYVRDSEVSHNEIHDGYYTGLSCGWIWGHEYQVTENVKITDNLIYDIGQGWLSDLGGMYLLGEQKDTLIARNVIYNVTRGRGVNDYGGNGIYTDAGSSYFTIEQNLIYDCAANGLNIGGFNKGHTVRGNIVAFCSLSAFDPGVGDGGPDDCTCECTGNIFYSDDAPVILDVTKEAAYRESGNLLWDKTNGERVFGSTGYSGDYAKKTKISAFFAGLNGRFTDDLIADPLFADPESRDFTLDPSSPALTGGIDFTPFDPSSAGLPEGTAPGCGSAFTVGNCARANDLSFYEKGCSSPRFPYPFLFAAGKAAPVLTLVVLAAVFILDLLTALRRKSDKKIKRALLALCAPCMAALLYPLYKFFCLEWNALPYGLCLVLFLLFAAVTPWQAFKKLPARLCFIILLAALCVGLTFLLNNVYRVGESAALFTSEFAVSLCVLAAAAAGRRP